MWIDGEDATVGAVAFLVRRSPQQGADSHHLQDRPARTNQSNEPRLNGWCGTTNNVAVYACGVVRVARIAANGRAQVVPLSGPRLTAALDTLGWPSLAE